MSDLIKCVCGRLPATDTWRSGYDARMSHTRMSCPCGISGPWRGTESEAIAAWDSLPRTVQAAPSDRERRLEEALRAYERFEANLLMDDESWRNSHPFSTDELQAEFEQCQRMRVAALAATNNTETLSDDPAVVARNLERAAQLFPVWRNGEPNGRIGPDGDK